jgi:PAS domain-containing protein
MRERSSIAKKDLMALAAAATVTFVVAVYFDVFEAFQRWAQAYERWQVDELAVVPLVIFFAFGLYSWRRHRELRESEEALREAEERYRTLVERIPLVTYIQELAPHSRTTYLSPQYESIKGYPREEALSEPNHWLEP